ncbi:hypothetical protein PO883_34195 [Massilia sp. DJPM01]|uniref:hypothetical protein n=1 Tax=Massilia sp. DJPM01 TaxID=3024404 RepID=UPI00259DA87E|nr:hypothetical protein [Massilia sp. DJPM01]MDM5182222.1 hypothetical protein [Massilia sp. DJPM01]
MFVNRTHLTPRQALSFITEFQHVYGVVAVKADPGLRNLTYADVSGLDHFDLGTAIFAMFKQRKKCLDQSTVFPFPLYEESALWTRFDASFGDITQHLTVQIGKIQRDWHPVMPISS